MSHHSSFSLLVLWNAQACRNVQEICLEKDKGIPSPKCVTAFPSILSFQLQHLWLSEKWWEKNRHRFVVNLHALHVQKSIKCLRLRQRAVNMLPWNLNPASAVHHSNVSSKAYMLFLQSWLVWWHLSIEAHVSAWFDLSVKAHSEEASEQGCAVLRLCSSPAE